MGIKPFLKWAGGKRWLIDREEFSIPTYTGVYIEPFTGGGAVFFNHMPERAILADINKRLIETYQAIKDDWRPVWTELQRHQKLHSRDYYYAERQRVRKKAHTRAAQFIYLNRACWNGLYRENLQGEFNVPIGTKSRIIFDYDDFESVSHALQSAILICCDFSDIIGTAQSGDFIFVDPPYTTAHNFNGFSKYNQRIFSWDDQIRLFECIKAALLRGATILLTNAAHDSVKNLYKELGDPLLIARHSVIAGSANSRKTTAELLYVLQP